MKNVLSFLGVVFGTALMYATLSCLISVIFCVPYVDVARFPAMVFIGGVLALAAGLTLGSTIEESDL